MKETTETTLEQNFEALEEILQVLEQDDLPLEEAFTAYSKGIELVKKSNEQIDRVEKEVLKLTEGGMVPLQGMDE